MMKRPSVILWITIDAGKAKTMSCYGYHLNTTPTIDRLAKSGLFFKNMFACSNHTDPSFTTMFSGYYPIQHGIVHHGADVTEDEKNKLAQKNVKFLPEYLKQNGYKTFGYSWLYRWHKNGYDFYGEPTDIAVDRKSGSIRKVFNFFSFVLRRIPFLYFSAKKLIRSSNLTQKPYCATDLTDAAIKTISENNNVFIQLHFCDVHPPYANIPQQFIKNFDLYESKLPVAPLVDNIQQKAWRENTRLCCLENIKYVYQIEAQYNAALAYIDYEISRLLKYLTDKDLLSNTLIILTADHGDDGIRDDKYVSHFGLYDTVMRVPCVLWGQKLRGTVEEFCQHVDILPTLLDYLGIRNERDTPGRNLLRKHKKIDVVVCMDAAVENRFAIRDRNNKLIRTLTGASRGIGCVNVRSDTEFYDLQKDPLETHDDKSNSQKIKVYKKRIADWIRKNSV